MGVLGLSADFNDGMIIELDELVFGVLFEVLGLVFAVLPFIIMLVICITVIRRVMRAARDSGQAGQPVMPSAGKTPSQTNRASQFIHRREQQLAQADAMHAYEIGSEKYSTQDPDFSFEGRKVVDEFAILRQKNAQHERHLQERLK